MANMQTQPPSVVAVLLVSCHALCSHFHPAGSTDTSLWTHYKNGAREYCGNSFPDGMAKNQRLAANVITPTTKSETHDVPISPAEIVAQVRPAGWAGSSLQVTDTCVALGANQLAVLIPSLGTIIHSRHAIQAFMCLMFPAGPDGPG
jgi:hypothetical protein